MKPGVLIISHGSPEPAWVKLVDEATQDLKLPPDIPVEASFLEGPGGKGSSEGNSRDIQSGIDALEAAGVTDMIVILLFVSSGSTHIDELGYALGLKEEPELPASLARPGRLDRLRLGARVHFGQPVDDDPVIASMLWDKLSGLSQSPEREAIILVGHGSGYEGFRQRWEVGISRLAERVKAISGAGAADYALLHPDNLRDKVSYWQSLNYEVIVAPLFLSEGYFTKNVIPGKLVGLGVRYSGETLLPHPALGHWISDQIFTIMRSLTF